MGPKTLRPLYQGLGFGDKWFAVERVWGLEQRVLGWRAWGINGVGFIGFRVKDKGCQAGLSGFGVRV